MNLEIHKPELAQRLNAHIQTGQFHDIDELIEKALDALDATATVASPSPAEKRRAAGRKSLVELFAPLRGLDLDFRRDTSTARPTDLS